MATSLNDTRKIAQAVVYFFLSTVITWYFIECGSNLYQFDQDKMLLSCSIAGAKWAIQIFAAFILLKEKRWVFISNIAFTCFIGSCILLPFCITSIRNLLPGNGFLISLIAAVVAMLVLYYHSVRSSGVSVKWYLLWVACLAIAISLQLTVVFGVI
ncbi:MAG: hypothetical protein K0Q79_3280 [Flavipsychrobacter sp.]|jgi:hypothetical protein|nr:hypothetical protein [Flavipsychrobacter sp.]